MSRLTDSAYLKDHQYKTSAKLAARIALHERYTVAEQAWHTWVMDRILPATTLRVVPPPEADVLELGCGRGDLWEQNAGRIPSGWRLTLTDLSDGMAGETRRRLTGAGLGRARFAQANIERIPFPDAHFDVVIANHMLHHVPDRARAISEVRRVLKPNGVFFASGNGQRHLRELFEMAARAAPVFRPLAETTFPFALENGREQLEAWFAHVTLERHTAELRVDAAGPMVEFILSSSVLDSDAQKEEVAPHLTAFIEAEIAAQGGAVRIGKDAGLFVAWG
jgi:ubiquinone/menaquinone biosynthesis C-methylase UbiE